MLSSACKCAQQGKTQRGRAETDVNAICFAHSPKCWANWNVVLMMGSNCNLNNKIKYINVQSEKVHRFVAHCQCKTHTLIHQKLLYRINIYCCLFVHRQYITKESCTNKKQKAGPPRPVSKRERDLGGPASSWLSITCWEPFILQEGEDLWSSSQLRKS